MAGGTILPKVAKAYQEFITLGLVEDNQPRLHSAQAAGCNPVSSAIQDGLDLFKPQKPNTIAKSIAIGNPADGYYVIKVVNDSGGSAESASDGEILDAVKLLARTDGRLKDRGSGFFALAQFLLGPLAFHEFPP